MSSRSLRLLPWSCRPSLISVISLKCGCSGKGHLGSEVEQDGWLQEGLCSALACKAKLLWWPQLDQSAANPPPPQSRSVLECEFLTPLPTQQMGSSREKNHQSALREASRSGKHGGSKSIPLQGASLGNCPVVLQRAGSTEVCWREEESDGGGEPSCSFQILSSLKKLEKKRRNLPYGAL